MGETVKEWMIGQNTYFWHKGVGDNQYWGHEKYVFSKMVMKGECPKQGRRGLLCDKKKKSIGCDGKNVHYLLEFEMCFIQLPNK